MKKVSIQQIKTHYTKKGNNLMNKLLLMLISITILTNNLISKTIVGEAKYQFGDSESLIEARDKSKVMAVRNALESFALYVESNTLIENYKLTRDQIYTISNAVLKNLNITHQEDIKNIVYTKITAEIDEEEVLGRLQKIAEKNIYVNNNTVLTYNKSNFASIFTCSYFEIIDVEKSQNNHQISGVCDDYVLKLKFRKSFPATNYPSLSKYYLSFDLVNSMGETIESEEIILPRGDAYTGNYKKYEFKYFNQSNEAYELVNFKLILKDRSYGNSIVK